MSPSLEIPGDEAHVIPLGAVGDNAALAIGAGAYTDRPGSTPAKGLDGGNFAGPCSHRLGLALCCNGPTLRVADRPSPVAAAVTGGELLGDRLDLRMLPASR
jgi:hypothetical protein